METTKRNTVGIYLEPHTRDRLNKFIADQRLATGKFISQSKAIAMLLDQYPTTAVVSNERPAERVLA